METSLQIKTRAEVKRMSDHDRLLHYEAEKREIMNDPTLNQYEITQAHAALREKWMI